MLSKPKMIVVNCSISPNGLKN